MESKTKCRECGTHLRDKNARDVGYCLYCYNMLMADPDDDEDDFQRLWLCHQGRDN
jgi:late competence protein required for DNA uptake (superfamily II DNA/RNA helicase)